AVASSGCGGGKQGRTPAARSTAGPRPVAFRASLSARTHRPRVGSKWWYVVRAVDLRGRPLRGRLTVQVVDPLGTAHPAEAGTSTLLNLIGALDRPDAGSIVVGGEELSRLDAAEYRAATVGFVFQFHNLIPTLSAAENVQIPMIGRGVARRDRERRSRALLEEVGLAERLDSSPTTLSGGERQRVAIA